MPRTFCAIVLAVAVALASGCGTVCNFASGDPKPYGGVVGEMAFLERSGGKSEPYFGPEGGGYIAAVVLGVWAADVCVCLVTDTLTLPLVYFWEDVRTVRWVPRRPYPVGESGQPATSGAGAMAAPEAGPTVSLGKLEAP